MLASIICHVYSIEKDLTIPSSQIKPTTAPTSKVASSSPNDANDADALNDAKAPTGADKSDKKESLTRSSLRQSLLYILSFIVTFTIPAILLANPNIVDSKFRLVLWMNSFLIPTYGIFLILIYTRPKVKVLAEMFPDASWFLCFSTVITSGGEVPPAHA